MTWAPQNPKDALSRADMLTNGVDAARHPLLGCVIAQNGTPPETQARNYLISLRHATEQQIAGRAYDLSEDEFRKWLRRLEEWEQTNAVPLPPRAVSADHPQRPSAPKPTPSQIGEAVQKAVLKHSQAASSAKP